MGKDVVIQLDGVWKRYGLMPPLRERWHPFFKSADSSDIWALRDLTFELTRGEMLGVIGRNGAGKSTLLKLLAGITPLSRGNLHVHGSIFSMIELNAGVHPELTGRENVYLLGAIMGFKRNDMHRLIPEIESFCELDHWFDQPIRKYSSGMLARLGFAVAANADSDILLIDEVLAVGDMAFRQKCIGWLGKARKKGTTVLFVSHTMNHIERLCTKAIYLEKGFIKAFGDVKETCAMYYEQANDEVVKRLRNQSGLYPVQCDGSREMRIVGIKLFNKDYSETNKILYETDLWVRLEIEVLKEIENPHFTVIIVDQDLNPIAHTTTLGDEKLYRKFISGKTVVVECRFPHLNLLRGAYTIDAGIGDQQASYRVDVVNNLAQFEVVYSKERHTSVSVGYFALTADWKIET